MKSILLCSVTLSCLSMAAPCFSQEDNRDKKIQSEQIIIQKDGNDSEKITIQVEGDQVTVNGKPLSDFDNERVKVKRKKMMVISDGNKIIFNGNPDELMDFGNSQPGANIKKRAFLGVVTEKDDEGARISSVSPGSAAEQAGLEAGDVITAIDGKTIDGPQTLAETIREYNPDDEITVERKVNKKYKKTKLKLGSREEETTGRNFNLGDNQVKTFIFPPITGEEGPDLPGMPDLSSLGIEIQPSKKQKLGLKIQDTEKAIGVKILELEEGTPAAQSGLKKDDVIVEINGQSIRNTDEARMELKESEKKENYHIKAERNGKVMEFDISIPRALKTINL